MTEAGDAMRVMRMLADAPRKTQLAAFERMKPRELRTLAWAWATHARDNQLPPPGNWLVWMVRAGRGFGKTRLGAEWVLDRVRENPGARIALVAATQDEARQIMIEGESGIRECALNDERPRWHGTTGQLRFRNGAIAEVFSGANGDGLRGPQHHFAWADELGKWRDADNTWDNLLMGLRLGNRPRVVVTTTPGNEPLMKRIIAADGTIETRGLTADNLALPAAFRAEIERLYRGTRKGRVELDGEFAGAAEGALWDRTLLDQRRIAAGAWGEPERIVVGVDPPAGSDGDACGILVCARFAGGRLAVLADCSVEGEGPAGWARRVADAARHWGADRVVAEANNGGKMVGEVLQGADVHLPVKLVHASRGKGARAEPIAALFETGKAGLAGAFPELEDELCQLTPAGFVGKGSPDRADAMVWAMTALTEASGVPGVRGL